jgi:LEA14-like dessication related protein
MRRSPVANHRTVPILAALVVALMFGGCATMQAPLEPPHVGLTDMRIVDATLFEQRYALKVRVQNPNAVALPIKGMDYRLDINDVELGRGVSDNTVTVPAYGEAVLEITLVSSLGRILDQVRALKSGKGQSLRYRLVGGISIANRIGKLPFDYHGEIGQTR